MIKVSQISFLVLGLSLSGCFNSDELPNRDQSQSDELPMTKLPDKGPCACTSPGAKRCAQYAEENLAQICNPEGQWSVVRICQNPRVCVGGACVEKGEGCPTRAEYDGTFFTVEVFSAKQVHPEVDDPKKPPLCLSGGLLGRPVDYSDSSTETHARELGFSLAGCNNPLSSGINFTSVFGGRDVVGQVSSAQSGSISGHLKKKEKDKPVDRGVFYRQTVKIQRVATLWNGNTFVGTATLTDWEYPKELAIGPSCPPSPKKMLPPSRNNEPTCLTWLDKCPLCL